MGETPCEPLFISIKMDTFMHREKQLQRAIIIANHAYEITTQMLPFSSLDMTAIELKKWRDIPMRMMNPIDKKG